MKITGEVGGRPVTVEADDPQTVINMFITLLKAVDGSDEPLVVDAVGERRMGYAIPIPEDED